MRLSTRKRPDDGHAGCDPREMTSNWCVIDNRVHRARSKRGVLLRVEVEFVDLGGRHLSSQVSLGLGGSADADPPPHELPKVRQRPAGANHEDQCDFKIGPTERDNACALGGGGRGPAYHIEPMRYQVLEDPAPGSAAKLRYQAEAARDGVHEIDLEASEFARAGQSEIERRGWRLVDTEKNGPRSLEVH